MKNRKMKKIIPLVVLGIISLMGCKGAREIGEVSETAGAMGRYVEAEIVLPEAYQQKLLFASPGPGELTFFAGNEDGGASRHLVLNGDSWTEDYPEWFPETGINEYIQEWIYGLDGKVYVLTADFEDENQMYHLYQLNADKTRTELLTEPLSEKNTADYPRMVDRIHVLADGKILISDFTTATLYDENGIALQTIPQRGGISNYRMMSAVANNQYITLTSEGNRLARYDLTSGKVVDEIAYEEKYNGAVYAAADGGVYVCDERGIHYWAEGGTVWQTLADGELNSLSMPSLSITNIISGTKDDFYVTALGQGVSYVYHYVYDENIPSVPSKVLSVFGLEENATVRQAIAFFQKENPNIRVDYRVALTNDEKGELSDIIKTLNTELLNGNGADVLLLDGLPINSYIEKGVLTDLSEIIKPMVEADELLESVISIYGNKDEFYGIPVRFILPVIYGDENSMEALESLANLNEQADKRILPLPQKGILVRKLMTMFYQEIFNVDGSINYSQMEALLATAKKLEAVGYYSDNLDDMTKTMLDGSLEYANDYGISTSEFIPVDLDFVRTGMVLVDGSFSMILDNEVIKNKNLSIGTMNNLFIPVQTVGISSSSKLPEESKAFVQMLLSSKIQDTDLSDGLPVNQVSLNKWMSEEGENYYIGMSNGAYELTAEAPKADDLKRIYSLAYELEMPILKEQILWDMIEEEGAGYLNGTISLEEAMARIESRTRLYYAE